MLIPEYVLVKILNYYLNSVQKPLLVYRLLQFICKDWNRLIIPRLRLRKFKVDHRKLSNFQRLNISFGKCVYYSTGDITSPTEIIPQYEKINRLVVFDNKSAGRLILPNLNKLVLLSLRRLSQSFINELTSDIVTQKYPNLTHFSVIVEHQIQLDTIQQFLFNAPTHISKLTLKNIQQFNHFYQFPVDLSYRLQFLEISNIDVNQIMDLLMVHKFPQLKRLKIHVTFQRSAPMFNQSLDELFQWSSTLPSLEYLKMSAFGLNIMNISTLYNYLGSFKRLKSLILTNLNLDLKPSKDTMECKSNTLLQYLKLQASLTNISTTNTLLPKLFESLIVLYRLDAIFTNNGVGKDTFSSYCQLPILKQTQSNLDFSMTDENYIFLESIRDNSHFNHINQLTLKISDSIYEYYNTRKILIKLFDNIPRLEQIEIINFPADLHMDDVFLSIAKNQTLQRLIIQMKLNSIIEYTKSLLDPLFEYNRTLVGLELNNFTFYSYFSSLTGEATAIEQILKVFNNISNTKITKLSIRNSEIPSPNEFRSFLHSLNIIYYE
ncbi:hypothetical protein DLAC_07732 [Tieghemostelium lacteum]|uniref:Uncharacterized protein n=1 Tax=Tieghemostelium lacteum TaxID=361077 RepID=A0A151ZA80_TIELA|nr:hypothetical protein DLAC_07732 [Tieghemostelium lacteum]|eukprot:KYQ90861.1 hypothetical protein DLAC_07732 [Tieghemostelium lacteum]